MFRYEATKINIINCEYYKYLNTINFVSKKGYNSYYEEEQSSDINNNTINWNKVIYPNYYNNIYLTNTQQA